MGKMESLTLCRSETPEKTPETRNTIDCDQSNVYSSRDIFSSISPNLPFVLSLYALCRLVTLSCEIA